MGELCHNRLNRTLRKTGRYFNQLELQSKYIKAVFLLDFKVLCPIVIFIKAVEETSAMESESTEDIESLIEDMDYIPGHFHLELNLNCDPSGPVKLRHRDTYLKQESLRSELETEVGNLQYAVRNLLGLLAFHLEQLDTAEEIFR